MVGDRLGDRFKG